MLRGLFVRIISGALVLALLLGGGGYALYRYGLEAPLPAAANNYKYTVRPGMNLTQVTLELAENKILNYPSALAWILYARWSGKAALLKAGDYVFPENLTARGLLDFLIEGKALMFSLTLVEGWTFTQVLNAVNNHPKLEHNLKGMDNAAVMARLGLEGIHPEGRFLPDTYQFAGGTHDTVFLELAYKSMQDNLTKLWEGRQQGLPLHRPEDALILASIVEKETGAAEERPLIAGVFINRLRRGIPLQTDPTVIYGLGDGFDGNLRRADLELDNPYNTYTRKGLPPTPIAMPGNAALEAVLHPAETKHLYFVAKGDGSHYFSETLKEHECAVIRYQLAKGSARFAERCKIHPGCEVCRQ